MAEVRAKEEALFIEHKTITLTSYHWSYHLVAQYLAARLGSIPNDNWYM